MSSNINKNEEFIIKSFMWWWMKSVLLGPNNGVYFEDMRILENLTMTTLRLYRSECVSLCLSQDESANDYLSNTDKVECWWAVGLFDTSCHIVVSVRESLLCLVVLLFMWLSGVGALNGFAFVISRAKLLCWIFSHFPVVLTNCSRPSGMSGKCKFDISSNIFIYI